VGHGHRCLDAGGSPSGEASRHDKGYDVMQVWLDGHQITDCAELLPHHKKPFCPQCSEKTITACPECNASIQEHLKSVMSAHSSPNPNNCQSCGTAFPWRQDAIASAIEILQMPIEDQDAAEIAKLVPDIAIETPKTHLAALKLTRLISNLAKPAYDISIKVVSDLTSETAKKTLGMK